MIRRELNRLTMIVRQEEETAIRIGRCIEIDIVAGTALGT